MMSGEETVPEEFFIRSDYNKTGAYIRVWARPLRSHDKQQVIGSVGFIRDVTKPKAVEDKLQQTLQELREQTQLMETIFNSISDGVIAADTNGRVLLINPIMQQMLGDIVDSDPREWAETYGVFLPDKETYASAEQIPLVSAMQGGTTDQIELFIRNQANAAGRYLSVSGRPLRENDGGELRGGVCVVRDITKSKMAEEELEQTMNELRNQSELMETTFNSISDGIVVADAAGNFLYVNSSAEQIVGMGATDEPQAEWAEKYGTFYPDQETPMPTEDLPLIRAIFKGESTDDEDIFIRNEHRPDGVYIRVSGRPLRNEIGGIRGGVITFRDVSEQMSAEEALMQAFAQGRLEIVDTILHNIGNAINSVTIGIEMVHQNLADDSLVRRIAVLADAIETHREDWVDYIQNDPQGQKVLPFVIALAEDFRQQRAERINTMDRVKDRADHIADIVRTQKVLSNPNIVRKDINLKGAISAAARVLQDSLGKRGIELTVDCENAPQEIRIQESQFHQMLVNLIKNSIEALDDLAAAGGLAQAPRIQIRAYSAEDFLHLDISDNGIGIDMKDAKRIFAAGYTTKNSGSGLGLHSAANFVIGSGGQIQPSSDGLGQGTTMSIMLRHSAITPV